MNRRVPLYTCLLLISDKFWMGGGRVGSQWGRSGGAELERENKRGGGGE